MSTYVGHPAPLLSVSLGGGRPRRKRKGSSSSRTRSTVRKAVRRSAKSTLQRSSRKSRPARLIAGTVEAKRFMAKLRGMKGKGKKRK